MKLIETALIDSLVLCVAVSDGLGSCIGTEPHLCVVTKSLTAIKYTSYCM